jgi:hypothetical protein
VRLACADDMRKARLSTDPDHEDIILKRLKFELYGHSEELVETLRDVTEVAVSSTMQQVLTELYSGKSKVRARLVLWRPTRPNASPVSLAQR